MTAAEHDLYAFHDTDRGLVALNRTTGRASLVTGEGGERFHKEYAPARRGGGRAGMGGRDNLGTPGAGERGRQGLRRMWVDALTGLAKEGAPP
jgi:hypothetical protein